MARPVLVTFRAGVGGDWLIDQINPVTGDALASAPRLSVTADIDTASPPSVWSLAGFTSNERYVDARDRAALVAVQEPLGRASATRAALIPIRKSDAWWDLTQDARRAILEERSHHIEIGLEYLPAVARRLHHCRDIGGEFDFLTWFEFHPDATEAFEEMVGRLRATEEWMYVEREVDIRLHRATPTVIH